MKTNKQNADFLHIGRKLLDWYQFYGRKLPWRTTNSPYHIWVCEIILQQTQVKQGLNHYINFVERFPDVETLANAVTDEVLLYWKGLGYYSRALNLHTAAQQIMNDYNGIFPKNYQDILKLKGVGKYTAAAVASICFGEDIPAVDGNFYRVLSRLFADDYDISKSSAFTYFSEIAIKIMPQKHAGDFNQAIMDLGSEVCKPKIPTCEICPLNKDCLALATGTVQNFPIKSKKIKAAALYLKYYFIYFKNQFLIKQRGDDFIWKKLYDFPTSLPHSVHFEIKNSVTIKHKLTHKNLNIEIEVIEFLSEKEFLTFASESCYQSVSIEKSHQKSFPKPLEKFILQWHKDRKDEK